MRKLLPLVITLSTLFMVISCAGTRSLDVIFGVPDEKITTNAKEDPLKVGFLSFRMDDEHGIVAVEGSFKNQTDKTIENVRIKVTPYDDAGKPVICRERNWSTVILEEDGPWVPGGVSYQHWPKVWYSFSVATIALESIEINFLDGSSLILPLVGTYLSTE